MKNSARSLYRIAISCSAALLFFGVVFFAEAATLSMSPSTGVYQSGSTFTVRVVVNSQGQSINAADATLRFNPAELSVVAVKRSSSIFNLWVAEPTYSNAAGTISFSGGLPSGYTGSNGNVMNVTFRAAGSGSGKVTFGSGSVLANDGRGTNVLTTMNGGTYTLQAASASPEPEVIEYVAPANTPAAPGISSNTHTNGEWSQNTTASLSWNLPSGVTSVRTLLNENPSSVPTKVYEPPIDSINLEDLDEGRQYLHVQFRNEDGWGRIARFEILVDSERPTDFLISQGDDNDFTNPVQTLTLEAKDETSEVNRFQIKLDNNEPYEFIDETASGTLVLPELEPGYHTVIIEAFDEAGNSIISDYSFTILAFERPVFTDYPTEINEEVVPVIKGSTRPNSEVTVTLQKIGGEPQEYILMSGASGEFVFIPEGTFTQGVYELSAVSVDVFGAVSERSESVRIAVQQPGYIKIGSMIVSVLSIAIPLVALLLLLIFGVWFMFMYLMKFRKRVFTESTEALDILHREFSSLQKVLKTHEANLQSSRKTKKLTKAEAEMVEVLGTALQESQAAVEKEIVDVTNISKKK